MTRTLARGAFATAAVLTAATLAACSSSSPSGGTTSSSTSSSSGPTGSITVYAAASLTEAFTTLGQQFEAANPGTKITFNFGASSDLSTSITQGAPADVFASAATSNMDTVVKAGDASNPTTFVSNTLEIATPPSNPAKITSIRDLSKSGVKVAVCDPAVPCGVVAATVLENAKVTVKPSAREADVKTTLAVVESGEVDAGLVYVTDVRAAGTKVKGITIPASVNAKTDYPIAPLSDSKNTALASAFVAYVLSSSGHKVLLSDGFSQP